MFLTKEELFLTVRLTKVFRTNVYTLDHDASANTFIDFNTNRVRVNVKDASNLTVVVTVGHTFVYGTVNMNGNIFMSLEDGLNNRRCAASVLTEITWKDFPALATETLGMSHFGVDHTTKWKARGVGCAEN